MSTQKLYDSWSNTYDTVDNKTRDLELHAAQQIIGPMQILDVLELGCGTGKNTAWLSKRARQMVAVDFSEKMMAVAKEKVANNAVLFVQADITKPWNFIPFKPQLITCTLVLEHVQDLHFIFQQAAGIIDENGFFYCCELHPYKQYTGSKARFETEKGAEVLECFNHHTSDYFDAATANNFSCISLKEWFDDGAATPRLLSLLFQKKLS